MSDTGWIKIHRKFQNWEWYQDGNTMRVFLHLLLTANHKDIKWRGSIIKRGQVLTGRKKLAKALKLTEDQIRTAIKHLKSTNEITSTITNRYTIITICKFDDYQTTLTNESPTKSPTNSPADPQQIPTNKNVKNVEKEEINTLLDPPGSNSVDQNKPDKKDSKLYRETQSCMPHARFLARIVQGRKNIDIDRHKKWAWSNEIRKLIYTSERVGHERVDAALRWYWKNAGGEYVPVIESGKSFRDKFAKLEAAMERGTNTGYKRRGGTKEHSRFDDEDTVIETIEIRK